MFPSPRGKSLSDMTPVQAAQGAARASRAARLPIQFPRLRCSRPPDATPLHDDPGPGLVAPKEKATTATTEGTPERQ